jgi:hypothetical protein
MRQEEILILTNDELGLSAEISFIEHEKRPPYKVICRDADSGNIVTTIFCPTHEQALQKTNDFLNI